MTPKKEFYHVIESTDLSAARTFARGITGVGAKKQIHQLAEGKNPAADLEKRLIAESGEQNVRVVQPRVKTKRPRTSVDVFYTIIERTFA